LPNAIAIAIQVVVMIGWQFGGQAAWGKLEFFSTISTKSPGGM
jgi:hypothetical protein